MATERKSAVCVTVGELKAFLNDLPPGMQIQGDFDDPLKFTVWKRDEGEFGPRLWLGVDEE